MYHQVLRTDSKSVIIGVENLYFERGTFKESVCANCVFLFAADCYRVALTAIDDNESTSYINAVHISVSNLCTGAWSHYDLDLCVLTCHDILSNFCHIQNDFQTVENL